MDEWSLEENLAAFGVVSWRSPDELDFASINILKTECSLRDYFDLSEEELQGDWKSVADPYYLRLDLDYNTLGPIGTHPFPHVHFSPDGPLRTALDGGCSTNVVVDFLEFVYRQFFHEKWLEWVASTWNDHYRGASGDESRNPFRDIVSAFKNHDVERLREIAPSIAELSSVLTKAKEDMYKPRANASDQRISSFPNST
ncbi:MAG: hypothetical protein ACRC1K_06270 [Planctomycetia bacterium]